MIVPGWGEFDAGIRIMFKDPTEQPVDLAHLLKLYPPLNPNEKLSSATSKKVTCSLA